MCCLVSRIRIGGPGRNAKPISITALNSSGWHFWLEYKYILFPKRTKKDCTFWSKEMCSNCKKISYFVYLSISVLAKMRVSCQLILLRYHWLASKYLRIIICRVSDPHFFCGSGSGQKSSCGSGSWGYPGEGAGGKGKKWIFFEFFSRFRWFLTTDA